MSSRLSNGLWSGLSKALLVGCEEGCRKERSLGRKTETLGVINCWNVPQEAV